jgi:hypothetical protein
LVSSEILQYAVGEWEWRGATSLASFALVVLALGLIRRHAL